MDARRRARAVARAELRSRRRRWTEAELRAPALVVSPHPDDETRGCGGTTALKRRAGGPVRIVFVADGRRSHGNLTDEAELVARRRAEATAAAGVLGVPAVRVEFLGVPDDGIGGRRDEVVGRLREIVREARPEQVFLPFRRDGTMDHVLTNRAARRAVAGSGERPELLEYPIWFWNRWPWTPGRGAAVQAAKDRLLWWWARRHRFRHVHDVGEALPVKRRALAEHRSQTERPGGRPDWPVLGDVAGGEWLDCLLQDFETFWRTR